MVASWEGVPVSVYVLMDIMEATVRNAYLGTIKVSFYA
jgi:hypothetical protein